MKRWFQFILLLLAASAPQARGYAPEPRMVVLDLATPVLHHSYLDADGSLISLMDPSGLCASEAAWGSQFAGWLDRNVTSPLNSVSTTSTLANWAAYNADSLVGGFADWFRLGEGAVFATYGAQDGWDVAIGITSDVGRAAVISLIAGGGLQATVGGVGTAGSVSAAKETTSLLPARSP